MIIKHYICVLISISILFIIFSCSLASSFSEVCHGHEEPCLVAHFDKDVSVDVPNQVNIKATGGRIISDGFNGGSLNLLSGEYISIELLEPLELCQGTIMFWVRPHWGYYTNVDNQLQSHTFISAQVKEQKGGYFVISDGWWEPAGSPLTYFIANNIFRAHVSSEIIYDMNHWMHIACGWKSGSSGYLQIYTNGKIINERIMNHNLCNAVIEEIFIGCDKGSLSSNNRWADSDIDELMVFDVPLNSMQILRIYDRQHEGFLNNTSKSFDQDVSSQSNFIKDETGVISETRAIFDEGVVWTTPEGCHKIINKIKRAGFNVYVPCVWHGRGTRYPSRFAPHEPSLSFQNYDPLENLIRIAHENDIEVHPWFCVTLRQRDFLKSFYGKETPDKAFDLHRPQFIDFFIELIKEVTNTYDIDGINLDYIRTMGICRCNYCQAKYRKIYQRDLLIDSSNRTTRGALINSLQAFQDNAVETVVRRVSETAKSIRPNTIVSVDGQPKPSLLVPSREGRQEVKWANLKVIDRIYYMDYSKRPDFERQALVRKELNEPRKLIPLLGNFEMLKDGECVPRHPKLVGELASYVQRRWPGGVAFYIASKLDEKQIEFLSKGPFSMKAIPLWDESDR